MSDRNVTEDGFELPSIDPTERLCFIERTGVLIRWLLTATFLIIQFTSPIVPVRVAVIALPLVIAYNAGVQLLLKYRCDIYITSYITAVVDILVSLLLLAYAAETDIYLWYFVLLVSHSARFGFLGSVLSPVLFSAVYTAIILVRGLPISYSVILFRALFFIVTGVVSGYLARKEHLEFDRILRQQQDILLNQQKRKEMRDMLSRYLSFNLVEELLKSPEKIRLGGTRQKVTVLFSDISGFTRLLSAVDPERVIEVLNEYLTEMTNIVFENGGMVDKYVGDALIGIFGAPYTSPDDSLRAVRTALAMQERLKELQAGWKETLGEIITARIAVNTGDVILGNIGSPRRMDYTAIGDPVNIAARLQAIAELGAVVISKSTFEEDRSRIRIKNLGKVELKGKDEPIDVYQVLAVEEEVIES
jgi:class 3 adenylate cyclase